MNLRNIDLEPKTKNLKFRLRRLDQTPKTYNASHIGEFKYYLAATYKRIQKLKDAKKHYEEYEYPTGFDDRSWLSERLKRTKLALNNSTDDLNFMLGQIDQDKGEYFNLLLIEENEIFFE